ncbi:MAG: hypothetical protein Q8Q59_13360 [Luteolibacter sp.]|jgi:hypothetical protein|nr:hypothetical protein [Luteolibacter sp.]
MKTKVIKDNWPERIIQIPSGEKIRLTADDPDDVTRVSVENSKNEEIGHIGFFRFEPGDQGDEALLLTALDLDRLGPKYIHQGIGRAILQMVNDHNVLPILAACPLDPSDRNDGAHLTGNGPNFVRKMRELDLIKAGCDGNCLCGLD